MAAPWALKRPALGLHAFALRRDALIALAAQGVEQSSIATIRTPRQLRKRSASRSGKRPAVRGQDDDTANAAGTLCARGGTDPWRLPVLRVTVRFMCNRNRAVHRQSVIGL